MRYGGCMPVAAPSHRDSARYRPIHRAPRFLLICRRAALTQTGINLGTMLDSPVKETTLTNGIRVASEQVPHVHSVAIGLRVDAGARDEPDDQVGISHILEHMLFKGTERRTARDIAEELDAVGGHMDAFTTKEYTGYGTRVLPEHLPLALDVMADMLRGSLLDEKELELEKGVVLEEYKSLEDAPEEYVHEVFSRTL